MNTMNLMASEELLDLIIGASMMHNGKTDFLMDIAEGLNNMVHVYKNNILTVGL